MKAGRTSISSRIISMLLVVVMVLGMVPFSAFTAEAATTPTADATTNLEKIQAYAEALFNKNFTKASEYDGAFTWDKEEKPSKWFYFNGLMVDAFLAMDMVTSAGDARTFASNYYNYNIKDDGVVKRFENETTYLKGEVDSVRPARGLFDLLGTDQEDKYHVALRQIYASLKSDAFEKLPNLNGNIRHKPKDTSKENYSWNTWAFALDGTYMALPFLMEYAQALQDGKLTDANANADTIRNEVYTRLNWVATKMKDPATGLYYHGVKDTGKDFNNQFWTRGIGWYAMALVDVIELMPEGDNKTTLKNHLKTLFDGMLPYRDADTGLWYNITNYQTYPDLVNNKLNKLETSGSACMAYALMKAYNHNWVDETYGEAGLKAFNSIVATKLRDGEIQDIYKSASVFENAADYCDEANYKAGEAKGVGVVFLAAAEAEKTQPKLGVTGGSVTITDTTDYVGTVTIQPQPVKVAEATEAGTGKTTYEKYNGTTAEAGNYVIAVNVNGTHHVISNNSGSVEDVTAVSVTGDVLSITDTNKQAGSVWTIDGAANSQATFKNVIGAKSYYFRTKSNYLTLVDSAESVGTVTKNEDGTYIIDADARRKGKAKLEFDTSNNLWKYANIEGASGTSVLLFKEKIESGEAKPAVFAQLSGTGTFTYNVTEGKSEADVLKDIKDNYKIQTFEDGSTTLTDVLLTDEYFTWDKTLTPNAAGEYTAIITYNTHELGRIKVAVNGDKATDHSVVMDIAPNTLALDVNGTKTGKLTTNITVDGKTGGTGTVTWASSSTAVTVDGDGNVTAKAAATDPVAIIATLTEVTIGTEKYALSPAMTATVLVNVTDSTPETTAPTTQPTTEPTVPEGATLTVAGTTESTGTATVAKDGTVNLTVELNNASGGTITWSSSNEEVATVTANSDNPYIGIVTGRKAGGTATITAEWKPKSAAPANAASTFSTRAANSLIATFEVTVQEAAAFDGRTYSLFTGDLSTITSEDKFLIVDFTNQTHALKNTNTGTSAVTGGDLTVEIVGGNKITIKNTDDPDKAEWTFNVDGTATADSGSFQIVNGDMNIRDGGNNAIIRPKTNNEKVTVSVANRLEGKYKVTLKDGEYLCYDANNDRGEGTVWTRSKGTDSRYVLLFKADATGDPTPVDPPVTHDYQVAITPKDNITSITVDGTPATLTASLTDKGAAVTTGAIYNWEIISGGEYGHLSATTGESVELIGDAAGTVTVEVTETALSGNKNATIEITVSAGTDPTPTPTEASTYVLDTNGVDPDAYYLIVAQVGEEYYALQNLATKVDNSNANRLKVSPKDGIIMTNDALAVWHIENSKKVASKYKVTNTGNTITTTTYLNLNNKNCCLDNAEGGNAIDITLDPATGTYTINKGDGGQLLVCTADNFTRADNADTYTGTMYLYKKLPFTEGVLAPTELTMDLFSTETPDIEVIHGGMSLDPGEYTLSWDVGTSGVVSVVDGVLKANKPGNATVTVTANVPGETLTQPLTATINVTVAAPTLTISPASVNMYFGGSRPLEETLTVKVTGASGKDLTAQATIVWSKEDTANCVVFDETTRMVTAKAVGNATITATLKAIDGNSLEGVVDPPVAATCEVTVAQRAPENFELTPNVVNIAVGAESETQADREARIMAVLNPIAVLVYYNDDTTVESTVGQLLADTKYTFEGIDTVNTATKGTYTVKFKYTDPVRSIERPITVHVVDQASVESDGFIDWELTREYKKATSIVSGKEYLIVAFPTSGDTTNGFLLSNGNATNEQDASALSVSATVTPVADKNGFVTIDWSANDTRQTDFLWKWTFSYQEEHDNYFIYNFRHRIGADTGCQGDNKVLRMKSRFTGSNRVVVTQVNADDNVYTLTAGATTDKTNYIYYDGGWKISDAVSSTSAADKGYKVYLYERVTTTDHRDVKFSVDPTIIDTHIGMTHDITPTIEVKYKDGLYHTATQRNIRWTSDKPEIAKVDPNTGKVSALKEGTAKITATLFIVDGEEVVPNPVTVDGQPVYPNNGSGVVETVIVNVRADTPDYKLVGNSVTVRLGGDVDYSNVSILMNCADHNIVNQELKMNHPDVELDPLSAVNDPNADPTLESSKKPLNTDIPGIYYVPVYHLATRVGYVEVTVSPDPYEGLTVTKNYPEYPNAGGVRLRKFGTGGATFLKTGLARVELTTAGVSSESNVDVLLIVDVSNSMGWSMNWFEGQTDDWVKNTAKDTDKIPKIPEGGAELPPDKLDMAMKYASEFATTLLGGKPGNTLSFVTFAGNDLDNRTDNAEGTTYVDSVKTVFTSVTNLDDAKASFAGTKFTEKEPKKDDQGKLTGSVNYRLQIAGKGGTVYSDANGQLNRGNTNYDYAFGQAIKAVEEIKKNYQENSTINPSGKSYEESGRKLEVVFMTDGAPSHYNGERFAVKTGYDALWDNKDGAAYDNFPIDDTDEAKKEQSRQNWLAYIGEHNTLATQLHGMVSGMHLVGFDLDHGGFGEYNFTGEELVKVLRGVVQNEVLDGEQAKNEAALGEYFTKLAKSLTLAATDARVTDVIGKDFELYTGTQGDSDTKAIPADITIKTFELWTKADFEAGYCQQNQVGERKDEGSIIEVISFNADGTVSSTYTEGTVETTKSDIRTATGYQGRYFTYESASRKFIWNIGDMENKQYSLSYYVYLIGAYDDRRKVADGNYPTNEYAVLDYVDIYGDHASRLFQEPQVAWGKANIGVQFYLVDKNGNCVNAAGVSFNDIANRVLLQDRVYYNYTIGETFPLDASKAFTDAALGANYSLYGDGHIDVTSSQKKEGNCVVTGTNCGKIIAYDLDKENPGDYLHTIVDIPVMMTALDSTTNPLKDDFAVVDYGLPITVNVLENDAGRKVTDESFTDKEVELKVIGFAPYNKNFATTTYVNKDSVTLNSMETACGTYSVKTNEDGTTAVVYTPKKILDGAQKVFVAVELHPKDAGVQNYKILLSTLTIVPATVMYYETDGDMKDAFTYTGAWTDEGSPIAAMQDAYQANPSKPDIYGYDSHYATANSTYSNGSSKRIEGVSANDTKVSFTFTGTGFDIISRTGLEQGTIRVKVFNHIGELKKNILLINQGKNELYQIPVISVDDLEYGTYTVEIGVLRKQEIPGVLKIGNEFYFDAVRIYGTLAGKADELVQTAIGTTNADGTTTYTNGTRKVSDIYAADGEANTVFSEIRNSLISAESFGKNDEIAGAMFVEGMEEGKKPVPADYAAQGPNNEVYLKHGNAIAFSFNITQTNKTLHLGMKRADSSDSSTVKAKVTIVDKDGNSYSTGDTNPITTNSCTAMFYDLLDWTGFPKNYTGTVHVVISNIGEGILSLTDLKHTNGSDFVVTAEALDAAKHAENKQLDVITVAMPDNVTSVRRAEIVKLKVTTEASVTSLRITNQNNVMVWCDVQDVTPENADSKLWEVTLRPILLGDQTYTLVGMNADGQYGNSQEVVIPVTLY